MKTKTEIVGAAMLVKMEIAIILNDYKLIESNSFRMLRGLVVFTKDCPFAEYRNIFFNTKSFPRGSHKFTVPGLMRRYQFWTEFITEVQEREEQDPLVLIKKAVSAADKKVTDYAIIKRQYSKE